MNMQKVCPITDKRINEHVARVNGGVTVVLVLAFMSFGFWPGLLFLSIDFAIRGFINGKYSVLSLFSKFLVRVLGFAPKMVNAGPKIFAAQFGWGLATFALIAFSFGCSAVCLAIAGVLVFFSFLESFFGYCVACQLYPLFRRKNE